MVAGASPVTELTVADDEGSPTTTITEAIGAVARVLQQEVQRTLLGLVVGIITMFLVLAAALVFLIVGIVRLSDALGRACAQWFTNPVVADVVVSLTFLAVPLLLLLLLRRRASR